MEENDSDEKFGGRNRDDAIELLYSSSDFEMDILKSMNDDQLQELWVDMEMDNWLGELEDENLFGGRDRDEAIEHRF